MQCADIEDCGGPLVLYMNNNQIYLVKYIKYIRDENLPNGFYTELVQFHDLIKNKKRLILISDILNFESHVYSKHFK